MIRVSDKSRYRGLACRINLFVVRECSCLPVAGRGKQEETMRAVTVYRLDNGSNTGYRTRHPIGSILELRNNERVNNYNDLLRLAWRLFASDTADAVHIVIDVRQARRAILPELTIDCSTG
jgi:hypothetical protein